jgi:hypothetical protein
MKKVVALLTLLLLSPTLATLRAQSVDNPRVVTVSPDGTGADFSSLKAALDSITDASATNPYVILVYPGIYTGSNNGGSIRWKSHVSLRGVERRSTIVRGHITTQSLEYPIAPLFDMNGLVGIEVSNITLDGTAQTAEIFLQGYQSGALWVCGAKVTLNNVTHINGNVPGIGPATSLSSYPGESTGCGTGPGEIIIRNSDLAPIYDFANSWTISGTRIRAISGTPAPGGKELVYAYIHAPQPGLAGKVSIVGSTLESIARAGDDVADNYPVYVAGRGVGMEIVGSVIIGRTEEAAPDYDTAAVFIDGFEAAGNGTILIEGSLLQYESVSGATSGEFYGVLARPELSTTNFSPLDIRGSSIRSFGSGGSRADVQNETNITITLAATQHSTKGGSGVVTTADLRQGQFSADLRIPLAAPATLPILDGSLWVDTFANRLCYRSGGQTRCLTGSAP